MEVNGAFFVYQKENRENLLAQAVAASQQVVLVDRNPYQHPGVRFCKGQGANLRPFAKILHHTQLGRLAIDALQ